MSSGESCLDRGDMCTREEHRLHGNQNPGESLAGDRKPSLFPVFFLPYHSDLPGQVCYLPPAVKISSQPQPRDNKEEYSTAPHRLVTRVKGRMENHQGEEPRVIEQFF